MKSRVTQSQETREGSPGLIGQESRSRVMQEYWAKRGDDVHRYKARLAELVKPGMRILHAGCGWDKRDISRPYSGSCKVIGIDSDPRVASMFHSEFHLGSLAHMPFEPDSFDLVFCEYVVEHLENPLAAFREIQRVLKPGGRILVLTPNLYSYKVIAAACTPHRFHIWMGRIRFGRGQEADMYPTLYRCNTVRGFRRLARQTGLEVAAVDLVTTGPTWFEKFPVLFEIFDVFHRGIERVELLRQLRCDLIVELCNPDHATTRELEQLWSPN
jgi:ubiquinone/menaquinone biosynthesis C-methylase UbiE